MITVEVELKSTVPECAHTVRGLLAACDVTMCCAAGSHITKYFLRAMYSLICFVVPHAAAIVTGMCSPSNPVTNLISKNMSDVVSTVYVV